MPNEELPDDIVFPQPGNLVELPAMDTHFLVLETTFTLEGGSIDSGLTLGLMMNTPAGQRMSANHVTRAMLEAGTIDTNMYAICTIIDVEGATHVQEYINLPNNLIMTRHSWSVRPATQAEVEALQA